MRKFFILALVVGFAMLGAVAFAQKTTKQSVKPHQTKPATKTGAAINMQALMNQPRAIVRKALHGKDLYSTGNVDTCDVKGLGSVNTIYQNGRLHAFFVTLEPLRKTVGDSLKTVGYETPTGEPFRSYDGDDMKFRWWNADAKGKRYKRLGASRSATVTGFDYVAAELED